MEETQVEVNHKENALFAFLGAICALIVGLSFIHQSERKPASSETPSLLINREPDYEYIPYLYH